MRKYRDIRKEMCILKWKTVGCMFNSFFGEKFRPAHFGFGSFEDLLRKPAEGVLLGVLPLYVQRGYSVQWS